MPAIALAGMENIVYEVAVYRVERCYGGPEEGGWYYDAGTRVQDDDRRVFTSKRDAWDYANWLASQVATVLEVPLHSVNSQGVLRVSVFDEPAPKHFPEFRPHYE